jgi:hypothetical protein
MKHTIEYASARAEVWKAYWRAWASPRGLWIFHVAVGLLIATVMEMPSRAHLHMVKFVSIWLAVSAASTVLLSLWPQVKFKKAVRSMTVDPTGFTTTIGSLSGTRTWQEVHRIEDTGEEILIVGINGNAMVVPRRAFEDVDARSRFLRDARVWHSKHAV